MESLVVSLNMAKKLKAAEFPQGHNKYLFFWITEAGKHQTFRKLDSQDGARYYRNQPDYFVALAAPTAQELADQLPKLVGKYRFLHLSYPVSKWVADYTLSVDASPIRDSVVGDTMAEALANLWLKLHEGIGGDDE